MGSVGEQLLVLRREAILILKYYMRLRGSSLDNSRIVYMADGHMESSGMFDRLKGIVSLYALSLALGKRFAINHVAPFYLENYLQPNVYDWRCNNIQYCILYNRPIIAYPNNWSRLLNINAERHIYISYDIIDKINNHFGKNFEFGFLYRQLFKPSAHLQNKIDECIKLLGDSKYISVHLRLVNLLGDNTEKLKEFKQLKNHEARLLLEDLKSVLLQIVSNNPDCRIVMSTDSNIFRQYIKEKIPCIYCVPGNIIHVGNTNTASDEEVLKMFSDYYLLSLSEKVYSIVGRGLYSSQFPFYAAKIGNKPFERVRLQEK